MQVFKFYFNYFVLISLCLTCRVNADSLDNEREGKISKVKDADYFRDILRIAKSSYIKSLLNTKVAACHYFHEFSCGNYGRLFHYSMKPEGRIDSLIITQDYFRAKINDILEEPKKEITNDDPQRTQVDNMVKDYYRSCMNTKEKVPRERLFGIIREFGNMPLLVGDSWNDQQFDWLDTVAKMKHKYGNVYGIFDVDLIADFKNASVNRVILSSQKFLLATKESYDEIKSKDILEKHENVVRFNLRHFLGINEELARNKATEIVAMERSLAHGLPDGQTNKRLEELIKEVSVNELQTKLAPTVDVKKYLSLTLGEVPEKIYIYGEDYLVHIKEILSSLKRQSKEAVANYIFYFLLSNFFIDNPTRLQVPQMDYCIEQAEKHFGRKIENMVFRSYEPNVRTALENTFVSLLEELKFELREKLLYSNDSNWFTANTTTYALQKLDAMRVEINSYDKVNFIEEYRYLKINESDFFSNLRTILQRKLENTRKRLHQHHQVSDLYEPSPSWPFIVLTENVIKVPLAFLQPHWFFSEHYPKALKYGIVGTLLAHELIHAIDNKGRYYDKGGHLRNWWDDKTTDNFNNYYQCFVDQFNAFYSNTKIKSMSEIVTDVIALNVAFSAYSKWYDGALLDNPNLIETLPNLSYTGKQLFFIAYSQLFCDSSRPAVRQYLAQSSEQPLEEYRIIAVLLNSNEFSETFHCKPNVKMNPQHKCKVNIIIE